MKDSNYLEKVAVFMQQFNQPILKVPTIPSKDRAILRVKLLKEELAELEKALDEEDLVEVFDAFLDLQYVLTGAVHEFGLGFAFKEGFEAVHESNMTKACPTKESLARTMNSYELKKKPVYFTENDNTGLFNVYDSTTDKVLKSADYKPVNLKPILKKYAVESFFNNEEVE